MLGGSLFKQSKPKGLLRHAVLHEFNIFLKQFGFRSYLLQLFQGGALLGLHYY